MPKLPERCRCLFEFLFFLWRAATRPNQRAVADIQTPDAFDIRQQDRRRMRRHRRILRYRFDHCPADLGTVDPIAHPPGAGFPRLLCLLGDYAQSPAVYSSNNAAAACDNPGFSTNCVVLSHRRDAYPNQPSAKRRSSGTSFIASTSGLGLQIGQGYDRVVLTTLSGLQPRLVQIRYFSLRRKLQ